MALNLYIYFKIKLSFGLLENKVNKDWSKDTSSASALGPSQTFLLIFAEVGLDSITLSTKWLTLLGRYSWFLFSLKRLRSGSESDPVRGVSKTSKLSFQGVALQGP